MFIISTINKNEVPHLSCMREQSLTFSGTSSTPCSYALIVLCSAPWYIYSLRMSFNSKIMARYAKNIISLIIASSR